MYELTKQDLIKIKNYKQFKENEIALYLFEKFRDDLVNITFSKMKRKYGSFPLEKGDLISFIWKSIKQTIKNYKKDDNFYANLQNNCYQIVSKEIRKFFNNKELVMNQPISLEIYNSAPRSFIDSNNVCYIEKGSKTALNEIVEISCKYIKKYKQPTIKKILYFKSLGYSIAEICKILKKNRYFVEKLLVMIERIIKKYYF